MLCELYLHAAVCIIYLAHVPPHLEWYAATSCVGSPSTRTHYIHWKSTEVCTQSMHKGVELYLVVMIPCWRHAICLFCLTEDITWNCVSCVQLSMITSFFCLLAVFLFASMFPNISKHTNVGKIISQCLYKLYCRSCYAWSDFGIQWIQISCADTMSRIIPRSRHHL